MFYIVFVFGDGVKDVLGWNNFVVVMMKTNLFEDRFNSLANRIEGFRRLFEYI